jgi:hypothetical protein
VGHLFFVPIPEFRFRRLDSSKIKNEMREDQRTYQAIAGSATNIVYANPSRAAPAGAGRIKSNRPAAD